MRTISAGIQIGAAPLDVWAVLTDLSAYPEWNPLIRQAAGEVTAGQRLTLRLRSPGRGPATIRPRVLRADPGVELRWIAALPGVFGGEHTFALSPAGGGTRLVQSETYHGILVPLADRIIEANLAGFRTLNEAIKQRAESRWPGPP